MVSYEGFVYVSTEPTGGAGAWSPTDINESGGHGATHLTAVSCPSPSLCVAVSSWAQYGQHGRQGPRLDRTDLRQLADDPARRLAQSARRLLRQPLALRRRRHGKAGSSPRPNPPAAPRPGSKWALRGEPVTWTGSAASRPLSAPPATANGDILTSTDPAGGSATWSEANGGGSVQITGVSCPTASRCVAVDNNGDVLTSTDPTGGAGSWHVENLVPYPLHLEEGRGAAKRALRGLLRLDLALRAGRLRKSHLHLDRPVLSVQQSDLSARQRPRSPGPKRSTAAPHDPPIRRVTFGGMSSTPDTATSAPAFASSRPRRPGGSNASATAVPTAAVTRRCATGSSHGRHVLRVRAIGPTGLRGPAAVKHFRVLHGP